MNIREALEHLIAVIESHDCVSLSCDNDGEAYCDCLENVVKQAKDVLNKTDED